MQDDTFQITGYGTYDRPIHDDAGQVTDQVTVPTVQFDYQVAGQVYSTEHFLSAYGENPSAEDLTAGLQNWVVTDAKVQLAPPPEPVAPELQALVQSN